MVINSLLLISIHHARSAFNELVAVKRHRALNTRVNGRDLLRLDSRQLELPGDVHVQRRILDAYHHLPLLPGKHNSLQLHLYEHEAAGASNEDLHGYCILWRMVLLDLVCRSIHLRHSCEQDSRSYILLEIGRPGGVRCDNPSPDDIICHLFLHVCHIAQLECMRLLRPHPHAYEPIQEVWSPLRPIFNWVHSPRCGVDDFDAYFVLRHPHQIPSQLCGCSWRLLGIRHTRPNFNHNLLQSALSSRSVPWTAISCLPAALCLHHSLYFLQYIHGTEWFHLHFQRREWVYNQWQLVHLLSEHSLLCSRDFNGNATSLWTCLL